MNRMFYIRVDGNPKIGSGHIMRCLSIADAVKNRGEEITFILADTHMEGMVLDRGYQVICLHSVWNNMEMEICKMVSVTKKLSVERLIIDSYFVTSEYLKKLLELSFIIYIDDLNAFNYPCNMLINYNFYVDKCKYSSNYLNTELVLGCKYAPLREEFRDIPRRILNKEAYSVLVTTGGNDPFNVACKLVTIAKESLDLRHLNFHIVAGLFNPYMDELNNLERKNNTAIIHKNIQRISKLMLYCDIAVSAGGSTLYELCACGIPTIAFSITDNQLDAVNSLGDGYMINAGDIRKNEELCLNKILDGLRCLVSDYELRCNISEKSQKLIDGRGASRIAEKILDSLPH